MAIEDAVVLARSLVEASDARGAFERFYRSRARRTARIVRLSRMWGALGLWRQPALVALRDAGIRLAGGRLEAAGRQQYCYDPGPLPQHA